MPSLRLLNTVVLPQGTLYPGSIIQPGLQASVASVGGTVASDSDPNILAAANLCTTLRLNGRSEGLDDIMQSAASLSLTQGTSLALASSSQQGAMSAAQFIQLAAIPPIQSGSAVLTSGTVTIAANITANSKIVAVPNGLLASLTTYLAVPTGASRTVGTPGGFVVNGEKAAQAGINTVDSTSGFDWFIIG